MKRNLTCAVFLTALAGFLPAVVLLAALFDYEILVKSHLFFAIISTALFCGSFAVLQINPEKACSRAARVLFALLTPLSIVNLFVCMFFSQEIVPTALMFLWVILSVILLFQKVRSLVLKVLLPVLFALCVLLFLMAAFLLFTFGQIGYTETVTTVLSPEGTYRAEVVMDDQGGLGGNTLVKVYDVPSHLDLYLVAVQKKPRFAYRGEWGEFRNMEISWQTEETLLINGQPYPNPFS